MDRVANEPYVCVAPLAVTTSLEVLPPFKRRLRTCRYLGDMYICGIIITLADAEHSVTRSRNCRQ